MTKHRLFKPQRNVVVKLVALLIALVAITSPKQASAVTVVEYYVASNNSYFLTGRAEEQATLDTLPASFKRTGTEFDAFSAAASSTPTGTEAYCRFYISIPAQNVSSHFYGNRSSDCPVLVAANIKYHPKYT